MGILCDPNFESGGADNEKVNDIIATVSFISDAMGSFIENSVLCELRNTSAKLSELPGSGISKVPGLPHSMIVHWMVKEMSYREKLKMCKDIAPSLFDKQINGALGKMGEIRNRVAHDWSRGAPINQATKEKLAKVYENQNIDEELKDINDEYNDFQKLYNEYRNFILTLEQKSSSEFLGLNK